MSSAARGLGEFIAGLGENVRQASQAVVQTPEKEAGTCFYQAWNGETTSGYKARKQNVCSQLVNKLWCSFPSPTHSDSSLQSR